MESFDIPSGKPSREPAFRRELLLASTLFAAAFVLALGVGAYILVKDLGEKEVFRMLQGYSRELETSFQKIPLTEPRKGYQQQKLVTTRLNEFLVDKRLFDSYEYYDEQGKLVRKQDFLREGSVTGTKPGEDLLPGQRRVQLGQRIPFEIQVPIEPNRVGRAVLNVSQEVLARQAQDFRDELARKVFALVGFILALLASAYLYVLRILRMTRRLEAETQTQERLSYLGLLSSGMAHEIKNPLNSIQMNLQLLEEELAGNPGAQEASSYLKPVRQEVRRLERLVNDFLLYARPLTPTRAPVDLRRSLSELSALVTEEARRKGLALAVEAPADLPPIPADDGLLRTALLNLIYNALHAEPDGGIVDLKAEVRGDRVELSVRDHGAGVDPARRERIFQIFITDKPGGTGLGLPISRRIAEAHGGTLELRAVEGPGALFVLSLPLEGGGDAA